MKKPIAIGSILILFLSGCGRPKHYKETAKVDFSGLYAVLANTYNLGVMVIGVNNQNTSERRTYWIGNAHEKNPPESFPPGSWSFYGFGFNNSGGNWGAGSIAIKCAATTVNLNQNLNNVDLNFIDCGSGNAMYVEKGETFLKNRAQGCSENFYNNFRC